MVRSPQKTSMRSWPVLTARSSLAIASGYSVMLFTLVMILRFG